MNYKLTIGIAFKNPSHYFTWALKSIFAQTFTNWELILLDDGSTDESLNIAKNIQDERVIVYSDGKSKGLNVRLNEMIQLANTPYFFRMDADDIMHPQRLEKQYEALIKHDNNTVIGTAAYSIDSNSRVVGFRASRLIQKTGFEARHSFFHPTVAASTEWFRRNPYSENFVYQRSEDAELWCRTAQKTKFINLSEPLLYYRENSVLSFNKYMETSFGLLHIIHNNFQQSRKSYIYLFSRELIKLWLAFMFNYFGLINYLVGVRYKILNNDEELEATKALLVIVDKQQLPLSSNSTS